MTQHGGNRGASNLIGALVADMATDIRRRVIEQGWFGQPQDGPASQLAQWGAPVEPVQQETPYDGADPWGWHREPERKVSEKQEPDRAQDDGIDL